MRIIRLQAEAFKRLTAVDISPEGNLVEIRGNNGNGKSSVLDAIFAAVAGAGAAPEKPVRDGEEAAIIRLDLGDMIVTRTFTAEGTTSLKVTTADGANYSNGQTMLNELVGHISFDPLEFLNLKPDAQAEELKALVDIVDPESGEELDLEALAKLRAEVFEERRGINRQGRDLKGEIDGLGGVRHVPDDAPSVEDLRAKLASASEHNSGIEREKAKREAQDRDLAQHNADIAKIEQQIEELKRSLEEGVSIRDDMKAVIDAREPLAEAIDVSKVSEQLTDADRIAENRRHNEQLEAKTARFEQLRKKSEGFTADLTAIDKKRADAIAAAEMPVEGLDLVSDESGKLQLLFNAVPFSQASDAERLRVSCAVAMAANPKLRVLRLKDASLLDKTSIEALRGMADENDFQVWAEFVGDDGPGIIMEAGEVRGAEQPEELPKPRRRKKKAEAEDATEGDNSGDLSTEGKNVNQSEESQPASRDTLFERMAELPKPAEEEVDDKPAPKAITEFRTTPRKQDQ